MLKIRNLLFFLASVLILGAMVLAGPTSVSAVAVVRSGNCNVFANTPLTSYTSTANQAAANTALQTAVNSCLLAAQRQCTGDNVFSPSSETSGAQAAACSVVAGTRSGGRYVAKIYSPNTCIWRCSPAVPPTGTCNVSGSTEGEAQAAVRNCLATAGLACPVGTHTFSVMRGSQLASSCLVSPLASRSGTTYRSTNCNWRCRNNTVNATGAPFVDSNSNGTCSNQGSYASNVPLPAEDPARATAQANGERLAREAAIANTANCLRNQEAACGRSNKDSDGTPMTRVFRSFDCTFGDSTIVGGNANYPSHRITQTCKWECTAVRRVGKANTTIPQTPTTLVATGSGSSYQYGYPDQNFTVMNLQVFLDDHGYPVAPEGSPGSLTNLTNVMGPATQAALRNFQIDEGLSKTSSSAGRLGPWTMLIIQERYGDTIFDNGSDTKIPHKPIPIPNPEPTPASTPTSTSACAAPGIVSISPSSVVAPAAGQADNQSITLTLDGTNFTSSSVVYFGGSERATTLVPGGLMPDRLSITIQGIETRYAGTENVQVFNPRCQNTPNVVNGSNIVPFIINSNTPTSNTSMSHCNQMGQCVTNGTGALCTSASQCSINPS